MTGSCSCLGESDRESLTTEVTHDYDTVTFKGITIRSTPEIVLSSKRNKQLQESEDKRMAEFWMINYYRGKNSLAFYENHFF